MKQRLHFLRPSTLPQPQENLDFLTTCIAIKIIYADSMSTIRMTMPPSSDGSLHLPIPSELQKAKKLHVVAWVEVADQAVVKSGAGAWAKEARGIVSLPTGMCDDDLRADSLRYKFEN